MLEQGSLVNTFCFTLSFLTLIAITSGQEAPLGKYRFHVSIRSKGEHQCSGSIINNRHILTAHACIIGTSISDLTAVVGTNSLKTGGVTYKIQDIITPDTSYDDIVLLQTHSIIAFNYKVTPIEITAYDYNRIGYPTMITAFIQPSSGKPFTEKLQAYEYEIADRYQCMEKNGLANDRFMCFIKSDRERVCSMDFGGAIVAGNYLIGVRLPGDTCVGNKPEQHLRIFFYLQSIQRKLHLNPETNSCPVELILKIIMKHLSQHIRIMLASESKMNTYVVVVLLMIITFSHRRNAS